MAGHLLRLYWRDWLESQCSFVCNPFVHRELDAKLSPLLSKVDLVSNLLEYNTVSHAQTDHTHWFNPLDSSSSRWSDPLCAIGEQCVLYECDRGVGIVHKQYHGGQCNRGGGQRRLEPAISSVADTQGNTFTQAVANGSDAIFYATNIKGGADTVTANFAASTGYSVIYIHEYAGLATSPLDQVSSQTGTGTAVTSGAKTTTQANELIFGYAAVDNRVSGGGTGFTVRQTAGGNMSEDMIVSVDGHVCCDLHPKRQLGMDGHDRHVQGRCQQ